MFNCNTQIVLTLKPFSNRFQVERCAVFPNLIERHEVQRRYTYVRSFLKHQWSKRKIKFEPRLQTKSPQLNRDYKYDVTNIKLTLKIHLLNRITSEVSS